MEYNICEEYIHIIRSKIRNREYDKAIISANKVIEYRPEFSMAYYLRGICYYAKGEFIKSISDYSYAIAFSKDFAKAHFNMGVAKYKLKKYDDAIADIKSALNLFKEKNDQIAARKCVESLQIIEQEKI